MKRVIAGVALVALTALSHGNVSAGPLAETESVIATFEGQELRLADSWGEAKACLSGPDGARCYRTEAELRRQEGIDNPIIVPFATCSSYLALYDGTSHTGLVLYLSTRGSYISLSAHGFDNMTSSYAIGACSARFYDGGGGSTQYPGSTSAGASANSMLSGWNNVVSTVYIL